jgi:uncharacterized protein (DUF1697 family)
VPLQAALLRGINVGSARRIAMTQLRTELTNAGFEDVRTYAQSGNILLRSELAPDELATAIETLLTARFGFDDVPVVVRERDELRAIVKLDPLRPLVTADKLYQVSFLDREVPDELAERLNAALVEPEAMFVKGREIYTWHPGGSQNSKLWRLIADRKLGVTATARNWKTVTTLLGMLDDAAA